MPIAHRFIGGEQMNSWAICILSLRDKQAACLNTSRKFSKDRYSSVEEYLRVDLSAIAGVFLICCIIPPIVAFLAYRYRTSWMSTRSKLLSPA